MDGDHDPRDYPYQPPTVSPGKIMALMAQHMRLEHGMTLAEIQRRLGMNRHQVKKLLENRL